MNNLLTFNEFLNENYNRLNESTERILTVDEVKDLGLSDEKTQIIIDVLPKFKKVYDEYQEIHNDIQELITKRNANGGEKWEDYQPKILVLAKKRDQIESERMSIVSKLAKDLKEKYVSKYLVIIEK